MAAGNGKVRRKILISIALITIVLAAAMVSGIFRDSERENRWQSADRENRDESVQQKENIQTDIYAALDRCRLIFRQKARARGVIDGILKQERILFESRNAVKKTLEEARAAEEARKAEEAKAAAEEAGKAEEAKAAAEEKTSGGHIVAIDAGHQLKGNSEQEPIGPGAVQTKAKVSSGTSGCITGLAEYELNLIVALKLKAELITRGYKVVMIRETNDVDISNRERAEMANCSGAEIFLRIHADSSTDSSMSGASVLYPSPSNPYVAYLSADSRALAQAVGTDMCEAAAARFRGIVVNDTMSGINWCTTPVAIIEMGFMSNPEEDRKLSSNDYQNRLVEGMADGVDAYFADR